MLEAAGGVELAEGWLRRGRWYHGPICWPHGVAETSEKALAVLDHVDGEHPEMRGEALAAMGWAEAVAGNVERAEELIAQVADAAARTDPGDLLAYDIGHAHSLALIRRGLFEEAYAPAIAAGETALRAGRPDLAYGCWINAAGAAAAAHDHERALQYADRAAEGVAGKGMLGIEHQLLAARSAVLQRMGRLEEARACADAERDIADLTGDPNLSATAAHDRGMVALATGDHADAERLLHEALEGGASVSRPLARLARAEALARLGRCGEAEAELRATALEPVGPSDFPDTLVPRLTRVQGLVAAQRGDLDLAARRLEEAADGWRRRVTANSAEGLTSALADFGRPVIGLVDPDRELERVLDDLRGLKAPV
jgi:tetratricopeptide (TPR) repeat protein